MSVATRLKVLVSCMKRAVRTRFTGSPRQVRWRTTGADGICRTGQLRMPEAVDDMVIDHPRRLHERVANRCPYELEAVLFQVLAHRIRLVGGAWNIVQAPPCILEGRVIYKLPNISVEAAEMPLHLDACFC